MRNSVLDYWVLGAICLLCSLELPAQELRVLAQLPPLVAETSGIEVTDANEIWTFNDSGGEPVLYLCDTLGNLVRSVIVVGAKNRDWEDIAQDDKGNFYIADIGNNENERQDLRIYKIPSPNTSADSVAAEIIDFSYADQTSFPPSGDSLNLDSESLFWFDDHLYLCTKNRTFPFDGLTYLYRMPDSSGTYIVDKMGSFDTKGSASLNSWITAADISAGGKLCLLSSDKMWVFYDFPDDRFFDGQYLEIGLGSISQKEAVCFLNESNLYITDEELIAGIGRNIYTIEIGDLLTASREVTSIPHGISIFPNPCRDILNFVGELSNFEIEVFDASGRCIELDNQGGNNLWVDLNGFPNSIFFVRILDRKSGNLWSHKIVKME